MMRKIKYLFLFFVLTLNISAQDYPASPSNYVTDKAGVLSESQQSALNAKLRTFEDSTTNQIFVYVTNSLNGKVMSELCQEIFHNWKIGAKGKNNGVLIAIFVDDHKFRIHTGYGLEGALPDILTKKIQDQEMKPEFKKNDYYAGINKGIDKLIYYSAHEFKADEESSSGGGGDFIGYLLGWGPNLILLLIILFKFPKKRREHETIASREKRRKKIRGLKIVLIVSIIVALIPCLGAVILFFLLGSVIDMKLGSGGSGGGSSWSSSDSDSSSSWSSSSSDSGFSGGGGGDSGGGGSDSDW